MKQLKGTLEIEGTFKEGVRIAFYIDGPERCLGLALSLEEDEVKRLIKKNCILGMDTRAFVAFIEVNSMLLDEYKPTTRAEKTRKKERLTDDKESKGFLF